MLCTSLVEPRFVEKHTLPDIAEQLQDEVKLSAHIGAAETLNFDMVHLFVIEETSRGGVYQPSLLREFTPYLLPCLSLGIHQHHIPT